MPRTRPRIVIATSLLAVVMSACTTEPPEEVRKPYEDVRSGPTVEEMNESYVAVLRDARRAVDDARPGTEWRDEPAWAGVRSCRGNYPQIGIDVAKGLYEKHARNGVPPDGWQELSSAIRDAMEDHGYDHVVESQDADLHEMDIYAEDGAFLHFWATPHTMHLRMVGSCFRDPGFEQRVNDDPTATTSRP